MGKGIANWKHWLFDHEFYLAIGVSLTITSSSVDQFEVFADADRHIYYVTQRGLPTININKWNIWNYFVIFN